MTSNNENPFPDPHNKSYIYRFHLSTQTKAMAFNGGYKIMTANALSSISIFPSEYYLGFPSLTTPCADIELGENGENLRGSVSN